MGRWRRTGIFRVAMTCSLVSILALVVVFGSLLFLFNRQCQRRVSQELLSPDNKYAVRAEEENCFVTTPFKADVLIADRHSFPFASEHGVFSYSGRLEDVSFYWHDTSTLLIEYQDCEEIYGQDSKWSSVNIIYHKDCGP